MRTLVLGLGNDLLSDDAVGLLAVRALRQRLAGRDDVEVVETGLAGLALLDYFVGFERAVVVDSICTRQVVPGTVTELGRSDLSAVVAPSPHFAGLPELWALAEQLELPFPLDIRILAIETEDPYTLGGGLSPAVRAALPALVERALALVGGTPAAPGARAPTGSEAAHV